MTTYKTGQEIEITITDIGRNGDGIGRHNGFTFFVNHALPGDTILARITKLKLSYGFAELIKLLGSSCDRVKSECPYSDACGGCMLSCYSYDAELRLKESWVKNALTRIGGVKELEIDTIRGMDNPYHYRNKAVFHAANKVLGYYSKKTHAPVAIDRCLLVDSLHEKIIECVGAESGFTVRISKSTAEVMVILDNENCPEQIISRLSELADSAYINEKLVFGKEYITESLLGIEYAISPTSFFQVNPLQAEKMFSHVLELAELSGVKNVLDLYCGTGAISLILARNAHSVLGIEYSQSAIDDANKNALANGINNARFICGDVEKEASAFDAEAFELIVLDPPRAGCATELLTEILRLTPNKIIYVSCDPATLARDLAVLLAEYEINSVSPYDMFPRTGHVETVVLLSKLKGAQSIEVEIELDDIDLTTSESKATYAEIKQYVFDKTGLKVSQLYIAQVKKKYGIIERANFNVGKGKANVPQVPKEKEKAIEDALRHFKMI